MVPKGAKAIVIVLALAALCGTAALAQALNPSPPAAPVKLVFIHHSTGENWLSDDNDNAGHLGLALMGNNYFVSDTNYGWGPNGVGDRTDIGNWWEWFRGPDSAADMAAVYALSDQNCGYSRLATDPGGENQIVMFKSCFPNSNLTGSPSDPIPTIENNPLRGQDSSSEYMTIANAKGIYIDILNYFASRQDKLFILVTAPPLQQSDTTPENAANARALNDWLVNEWLAGYPHHNVFVFDFYNVLTSNGGTPSINDLGASTGNHHRFGGGQIEHVMNFPNNYSSYPSGDSHPTSAGGQKASGEYPQLLNIAYHCWKGDGGCPQGSSVCTLGCSAAGPTSLSQGDTASFTASATPSSLCTATTAFDWSFGDGSAHVPDQNPSHLYAAAGDFTWIMTATNGTATCQRSGVVHVHAPQPGPTVNSVWQSGGGFKLKVDGNNFVSGIQAFIGTDTTPWSGLTYKGPTYLIIKGGSSLKAKFPVGVGVPIRFVNPDGQSATFVYTR